MLHSWGRHLREKRRRPFDSAARDFGLTVDRAGVKLKGEIQGRRVSYSWGGEVPTRGCAVWYRDGPLGVRLDIRRRNAWLPQVRKSSVTTGDESFDVLLRVLTTSPERLQPVLDERLRRHILDLAFTGSLHVTDKKVAFTQRGGRPTQAKEITDTISSVLEVAEALERSRT